MDLVKVNDLLDQLQTEVNIPDTIITSLTLTADKTAPQPHGTAITCTAVAGGGTSPYTFKWWLFDGVTWALLQDWTASTTYVWTPLVANPAFSVQVWARSANDLADAAEKWAGLNFAIS
jgi:hypothetical protein